MSSILWQRVDGTGLDRASVEPDAGGYRIAGTSLFAHNGASYDVRYSVIVNADWSTRIVAAHVQGPQGERRLSLRADDEGNWTMGGESLSELKGIRDVDLAFTPAAITGPIRRLGLAVGDGADIEVAYVAFPERTVSRQSQRYERVTDDGYRYWVGDTSLALTVQADGLVTEFPPHWTAIATS